jgi:retron-type reverse transcriptase
MMNVHDSIFASITSAENLFKAWRFFRKGKVERRDVQEFGRHLERNIFQLQRELASEEYQHSQYTSFFIHDPKRRHIRKAKVRDRIVHQVVYSLITDIIEPRLIHDLYSSRIGKGTHAGVRAVAAMTLKVSKNLTQPCWALKCDVKRFYDSVDHEILLNQLGALTCDKAVLRLLQHIVSSFHTEGALGKGLPIGNLTSQVFTNVYLNELDQFAKHTLKLRHYARFADDFVVLSDKKGELAAILPRIREFLAERLKIALHPRKIALRPLHQGIDFLGYVLLPHHRVLRTATKRRMCRKLTQKLDEYFRGQASSDSINQSLQSYLGLLSHADTSTLQSEVKNRFCWGM